METLEEILAEGRAAAEARMTARCTIRRLGEKTEDNWNPETLQYDIPWEISYTGPCRLKPRQSQDRGQNAGDQAFVESQYELSLPVSTSGDVRKDDVATIDSCPDDAALVGRKYSIVVSPAYSQGTARRFPVQETQ